MSERKAPRPKMAAKPFVQHMGECQMCRTAIGSIDPAPIMPSYANISSMCALGAILAANLLRAHVRAAEKKNSKEVES